MALLAGLMHLVPAEKVRASNLDSLYPLIGRHDSILVADAHGKVLIAKNEDQKLIPASILKIFTALVALHLLGPDYRFTTEFYLDGDSNLKIKGYGDPLLISEVVNEISQILAARLKKSEIINDLILDKTYFKQPLTIPGITSSPEPYDAPNGALCVNFNTVYFKRAKSGYISAEPQTPLLPLVVQKIRRSKLNQGRIVFSHAENEITFYAGKLFQYFLEKKGITFNGKVKVGKINQTTDRLIYKYTSRYSMQQIVSKLLEFSNNFITNQLFISCGAKVYGPPGTLAKGIAAALDYAAGVLKIDDMIIFEGSGIDRKNRVSAKHMDKILDTFTPYHLLMRREGREFFKTGTLSGINTRAGYIQNQNGELYRYAIMVNTPGKFTDAIMQKLLPALE